MTEKEKKQLLLRDLVARLPYGVKVQPRTAACPHRLTGYDKGYIRIDTDQRYELESIKPYLRPMSTMTSSEEDVKNNLTDEAEVIDFLNEHHFDYRNLIDKGLALEAPTDMYDLNK